MLHQLVPLQKLLKSADIPNTATGKELKMICPGSRFVITLSLITALSAVLSSARATSLQDATDELSSADLSALMDISVTSAAKRTERLATTSAAVTVITAEEISRMPVTHLQDVFRTVPGMTVARVSGNRYAISTRGGNNLFSGSLLVMVDGRTVYSPVFSGVWWDAQEIPLEEIARIEIVRGPGGTLWGANAVSGVINIITKSAATTIGGLVSIGTGSLEQGNIYARYGVELGGDAYLRMFGSRVSRDDSPVIGGGSGHDQTVIERAGIRYDKTFDHDRTLRITGEGYRGVSSGGDIQVPLATPGVNYTANTNMAPRGGHLMGRYTTPLAVGHLQVQGSVTQESRYMDSFGLNYDGSYAELELQHDIDFEQNRLVWGAGVRRTSFHMKGSYAVTFTETSSQMRNYNFFVQDELSLLNNRVRLTVGSKFEHDNISGSHLLPTVRLLYAPDDHQSWWTALSRATQTPNLGSQFAIIHQPWFIGCAGPLQCSVATSGGQQTVNATVDTLEFGYRSQIEEHVSLDMAAYFTRGRDLPSADMAAPQFGPGYLVLPIQFANQTRNSTRGVETSMEWQVRRDFRLRLGGSWYSETVADRVSQLSPLDRTVGFAGSSPNVSTFVRGSHDWDQLTVDWTLRRVGHIAAYDLDAYTALDLRAGWMVNRSFDLALTLNGLGGGKRYESVSAYFSERTAVEPEWALNAKWRF
jgi:iron complex outermembrane recepter protein